MTKLRTLASHRGTDCGDGHAKVCVPTFEAAQAVVHAAEEVVNSDGDEDALDQLEDALVVFNQTNLDHEQRHTDAAFDAMTEGE